MLYVDVRLWLVETKNVAMAAAKRDGGVLNLLNNGITFAPVKCGSLKRLNRRHFEASKATQTVPSADRFCNFICHLANCHENY